MRTATSSFDRLASCYRALEWLAFGGALTRVRFHHLAALAGRKRVLILGDGDGRFLARLVKDLPEARIDSVDSSAAMLARACKQLSPADAARVNFRHEDAREARFEPAAYDAVVTLFFLDCFTVDELQPLFHRLDQALAPGGLWLWADFALPPKGWRRLRARIWLAVLYGFLRWQTGLSARELPETDSLFAAASYFLNDSTAQQAGLLRSAHWEKPLEA